MIPGRLFFYGLAVLSFSWNDGMAQDLPAPLIEAEQARGVLASGTGVRWTVDVTSSEGKKARFVATSQGGNVHAIIQQPDDAAGNRYIATSDGKMWFWKPGLSRPVSVSKRQRLSGDAAIGDIASNSFVEGYKVSGTEADGGATIYTLEADSRTATYKKIRYWIDDKRLGTKAEFYAASGNLIRTATMAYGNSANGGPFLSGMTIKDAGRTVELKFSNVEIGRYPADLFDKDQIAPPTEAETGPRKFR